MTLPHSFTYTFYYLPIYRKSGVQRREREPVYSTEESMSVKVKN